MTQNLQQTVNRTEALVLNKSPVAYTPSNIL